MVTKVLARIVLAASMAAFAGCADDERKEKSQGGVHETDGEGGEETGNVVSGGVVRPGIGASTDAVTGDGHVQMEARELAGFVDVVNASPLRLQVREGAFSVVVQMDGNLLPYVETVVSGETLTVSISKSFQFDRAGMRGFDVFITLPALRSATTTATGAMDVAAHAPTVSIALRTEGTGDLRFSGEASVLRATSESNGAITLFGEAERVELESFGSGGIDADMLRAKSGKLVREGNGSISATITESVDVTSSGNGDLTVEGGATPGQVTHTGNGRLTIR